MQGFVGSLVGFGANEAGLSAVDRDLMRGRQFLNSYGLQDYRGS